MDTEWKDHPDVRPQATLYFNIRMYADRVAIVFQERPVDSPGSRVRWIRTVERPPGKSLAECLEAALYRIAQAGSDGSLAFSGQDSVT